MIFISAFQNLDIKSNDYQETINVSKLKFLGKYSEHV